MISNINNTNFSNTNNSIKTTKPNCTQDLNNNSQLSTEMNHNSPENQHNNSILSINDIPYTLPINRKEQKLIEINQNKFKKDS